MVGKTFTYLIGSQPASLFFNSKNADLNAEEVYSRLTTPVFGKGVAYDCPNPVCTHLANVFDFGYLFTVCCGLKINFVLVIQVQVAQMVATRR